MKLIYATTFALLLAGCNETMNSAGPEASGPLAATPTMQDLPPIYEPLVDMHRVNEAKYRRDFATCRRQAAPQEAAARSAAQLAEVGATLSAVGGIVGALPVASRGEAHAFGNTSELLQKVGGVHTAQGVASGDAAMSDYVLVVNTCLSHRGYHLLR